MQAGRAPGEVAATAAVLVGLPGGTGRLMGEAYNAAVRPVRRSPADIDGHLELLADALAALDNSSRRSTPGALGEL